MGNLFLWARLQSLQLDKPEWKERKERYIEHLWEASEDALLVSGCNKSHNARAIVTDLDTHGVAMFERFNAKPKQILWYYGALAEVFEEKLPGHAVGP